MPFGKPDYESVGGNFARACKLGIRHRFSAEQFYGIRQKQSFEQYLADQYEVASAARLETLADGTVLLVMCQDQDGVFDAIRDAIEGAR